MLDQPKVSVIVPFYNAERYLKQCLDSLQKQIYSNFEVLLINDGSIDQSYQIAAEYAKVDERFNLITQTNAGLASARNVGLQKMGGEYVTFVDGDDFVSENYLAKMIRVAEVENADLVIGNYYRYSDADKMYHFYDFSDILRNEEIRIDEFAKNITKVPYCVAWGKLYHQKLFDHVRFPDGRLFEDTPTTIKVALKATKIWGLNEDLYAYRITEGSITESAMSVKKISDALDTAEDILTSLVITGQSVSEHLADYYMMLLHARKFLEAHHLIDNEIYFKVLSRLDQFVGRKEK